jgi:serine/threonine protein kinase
VEGVLGEGSYGFVLLAAHNQQECALKEMSKYRLKKYHKEHVALIEKELLRKIAHPGVITASGAFQTQSKLYLVLETCRGGEFMGYARQGLSEEAMRFYFAELVNTVEYLHSAGIVHRDLKVVSTPLSRRTCCLANGAI